MSLELLNSNTAEGRELGYLCIRLATMHADHTSNPAALRRSLERRIAAIVKRSSAQEDAEPQRTRESEPISLDEARLKTAILLASIQ